MIHLKSWAVPIALFLQATVWAGGPVEASHGGVAGAALSPSLTLARSLSALNQGGSWDTVSVDIEAFLPKLAEHGRLRAVRRLLQPGRAEYQVLETEGDQTVKRQVIARYLTAEARAAAMPPASVAFTPANYKFRYAGSIATAGTLAYVYRITPRKKRSGLIEGELWIDAGTGLTLHQSGRLVRKPSVFLRRVEITRDTTVREGIPYARVTHLSIDTRLVGPAELTITERPCTPACEEEVAAAGTR